MQTTARKGNTLLGSVIKRTNIRKTWPLWLMMLIPLGALILFQYVPMAGLRLAFVKYNPTKGIWGSQWVGLKYFDKLFSTVKFWTIIRNTVVIAVLFAPVCDTVDRNPKQNGQQVFSIGNAFSVVCLLDNTFDDF